MIAVEWPRSPGVAFVGTNMAAALNAVGHVGAIESQLGGTRFIGSHRVTNADPSRPDAPLVIFSGHIDNAPELSGLLGLAALPGKAPEHLARLYGAAVARWGDEADLRIVGEYAAIVLDPAARRLRLARSPFRAPPLHYHASPDRVIAASAVRAIFACGIEPRLNEAKLADHALFNFTGEAAGWYEGLSRVPLGSLVAFTPDRETTKHYYDFAAIRPVRPRRIDDYVAEAAALFAEATRHSLAGSTRPAVMLSGGLDSALVATRALAALPADQPLDGFTFVPDAEWDGVAAPGRYGDERPLVEDLARLHPRLRPHYFANPDSRIDDDWTAMFEATGAAPINLVNLGAYQPMWRAARAEDCDRILLGEFGNTTISNTGDWGFAEFFTRLRWGRLHQALRGAMDDGRPLWRRFIGAAVLPLLPEPLWRWQRAVRGEIDIYAAASPLRRDYAAASGALDRAEAAGVPVRRQPLRDRMADFAAIHHETWGEFSDIYHGFEQIHGIAQRDPTAWRPLIEFCAAAPTELFLRGGENRWLARQLGTGVLPDSIRLNRNRGLHHADWHSRLGRQRPRLLALFDAMERVPRLAAMIDFPRLRPALEDWPASSAVSDFTRLTLEGAVPRAILLGRFVAWSEGIALE